MGSQGHSQSILGTGAPVETPKKKCPQKFYESQKYVILLENISLRLMISY